MIKLLVIVVFAVAIFFATAYYTWPCARLRANVLLQNLQAPGRCLK